MYSPALHSLLVQTDVEELQRAAQTYNRASDADRPSVVPLSTLIERAISRVFAGAPVVNAATLRPRS